MTGTWEYQVLPPPSSVADLPLFAQAHPTFGPAYDPEADHPRIVKQHERIRDYMLGMRTWQSLEEIERATGYPQASISAQLRHLRKPRFGGYQVNKRRRADARPPARPSPEGPGDMARPTARA